MPVEKFGDYWFDVNEIVVIEESHKNDMDMVIFFKGHERGFLLPEGENAQRCLEKFKEREKPINYDEEQGLRDYIINIVNANCR